MPVPGMRGRGNSITAVQKHSEAKEGPVPLVRSAIGKKTLPGMQGKGKRIQRKVEG